MTWKKINKIHIYDTSIERPDLPAGLTDFDASQWHAPFGLRTTQVEGRSLWSVATEDDLLNMVGKLLNISASEAKSKIGLDQDFNDNRCPQSGPRNCDISNNCRGFCRLYYDPQTDHYYCGCYVVGGIIDFGI